MFFLRSEDWDRGDRPDRRRRCDKGASGSDDGEKAPIRAGTFLSDRGLAVSTTGLTQAEGPAG
jgi:hypothetical protein